VALFAVLSVAAIAIIAAGLVSGHRLMTRFADGATFRSKLPWFLASMGLLLAGFVVVVEWRCHVGWIDQAECHVWD
jgi:hypothetical protein